MNPEKLSSRKFPPGNCSLENFPQRKISRRKTVTEINSTPTTHTKKKAVFVSFCTLKHKHRHTHSHWSLTYDNNNLFKLGTHCGFKWILNENFKFCKRSNIILTWSNLKSNDFMTNISYFFVEISWNIVKDEWNDTKRKKMKSSFAERIYYLKNLLSIIKFGKLGKRKKQRCWFRKNYDHFTHSFLI